MYFVGTYSEHRVLCLCDLVILQLCDFSAWPSQEWQTQEPWVNTIFRIWQSVTVSLKL